MELKTQKKNSNNNKMGKGHNFSEKVTTLQETQIGLFGQPVIKKEYRLCKNHSHLLGIFALNPEARITRNILIQLKSEEMHVNTISNFLKEAEVKGIIERCKVIPGTVINNAYFYQKLPDTFEDGSPCKDKRGTYYRITTHGITINKLNNRKF